MLAFRRIRMVTGQADDPQIPRRRVVKRDRYIRLLFSQCFFLRKRWSWNLKNGSALFGLLSEVFKNRKFTNLNGEASDFPSFVRHDDVSLLLEYRNSDTAFGLFPKLAVLAVKDMREVADDPGLPLKLRKLMSLSIPVGSVPFTNTSRNATHSFFFSFLSPLPRHHTRSHRWPTLASPSLPLPRATMFGQGLELGKFQVSCDRDCHFSRVLLHRNVNVPS